MSHVKTCRSYSRAEYISDAVVHGLGIAAALIAGPILIWHAATGAALTTAMTVYVVTMVGMWVCSALYNLVLREDLIPRLRRLDQSAIYFKIAGTYTPIVALVSGSSFFLAGIWAVAIVGALLILLSPKPMIWTAILLYLSLGWAGAVVGGPLLSNVEPLTLWFLTAGGLAYSFGIIFLMWHRLPFHNTIWHIFVLAGTAACFAAVSTELGASGVL